MARIWIDSKWYEQVEPSTFSETEFEDRIKLHAQSVYPLHYVTPFKKSLRTTDNAGEIGTSQVAADLAFVARDYSAWWVVEVEMGYHNLTSHVRPQVLRLLEADYSDGIADYLCTKNIALDRDRLSGLISSSPIHVLLIVNQPTPEWATSFRRYNVSIAVFELFRAEDNHEIFRVNGEYPSMITEIVSSCPLHPIVPRLLGVEKPDQLQIPRRAVVPLLYNGCVTEWQRIDDGSDIWLTSVGRNPLQAGYDYEICRRSDGQLVLRRARRVSARRE